MADRANRLSLRKQLNEITNLELNYTSDTWLGLKNALVNSIKYGADIDFAYVKSYL